jgi:hypothetical protein
MENKMNIPTVLKLNIEDDQVTGEILQHDMVVRLRSSAIIIEDANWILEDEKGNAIRSLPTFRVMLDAEKKGVRLYVWKQGSEIDNLPPDVDILIAGWEHGTDPTLEG